MHNEDVWKEYDYAAEWCAVRGLKGTLDDPLPENLSEHCLELINDDPEAFERRVNDTAYAYAMEKIYEN